MILDAILLALSGDCTAEVCKVRQRLLLSFSSSEH